MDGAIVSGYERASRAANALYIRRFRVLVPDAQPCPSMHTCS